MDTIDLYKAFGSIKVKPSINIEKGLIEFDCIESINDILISHRKDIMDTKDEITRKALILLGWTPPQDNEAD